MALGGIFNLMLNKTKSTSQHTPIYPSKMRTEQDKAKVQTKLDFFLFYKGKDHPFRQIIHT